MFCFPIEHFIVARSIAFVEAINDIIPFNNYKNMREVRVIYIGCSEYGLAFPVLFSRIQLKSRSRITT